MQSRSSLATGLLVVVIATGTLGAYEQEYKLARCSNGDSIMSIQDDKNYVITNSKFPDNWKAVSVNGDEVEIVDSSCKSRKTTLSGLTETERQSLESAKNVFSFVISNIDNKQIRVGQNGLIKIKHTSRYENRDSSQGQGILMNTNDIEGSTHYDDNTKEFIVTRHTSPNNWSRVMVHGDLVTTTSQDGNIRTRCESALEENERQFIAQVKEDVKNRVAHEEAKKQQRDREQRGHQMNQFQWRQPFGQTMTTDYEQQQQYQDRQNRNWQQWDEREAKFSLADYIKGHEERMRELDYYINRLNLICPTCAVQY